jgi:hypothetical protein
MCEHISHIFPRPEILITDKGAQRVGHGFARKNTGEFVSHHLRIDFLLVIFGCNRESIAPKHRSDAKQSVAEALDHGESGDNEAVQVNFLAKPLKRRWAATVGSKRFAKGLVVFGARSEPIPDCTPPSGVLQPCVRMVAIAEERYAKQHSHRRKYRSRPASEGLSSREGPLALEIPPFREHRATLGYRTRVDFVSRLGLSVERHSQPDEEARRIVEIYESLRDRFC